MKTDLKQNSKNVEKAITEINRNIYKFTQVENKKKQKEIQSVKDKYRNNLKNKLKNLIEEICKKYEVSEKNIKEIAKFDMADYDIIKN